MQQKTISTITRECTKEQIWKLMSNVNDWNKWDNSVEFSELQGEFQTGSTFLLKPKGGPKIRIGLEEVKPVAYFKDRTTFPLAKMYGEHWYEDTPEGLKVTVTMTITGLLSGLWYKLVMKDIVQRQPEEIQTQIAEAKKI
jgi:Polyketide cyclase / dehydrase and lipid transport